MAKKNGDDPQGGWGGSGYDIRNLSLFHNARDILGNQEDGYRDETGYHSGDNEASDTWTRIARADWDRYKEMYQPVEDYLVGMVNNPAMKHNMEVKNLGQFDKNIASSEAGYQRGLQGYGLQLSPEQKASHERQYNVTKGLGEVESVNRTRRGMQDLENTILGAGGRPDVAPQNPPLT